MKKYAILALLFTPVSADGNRVMQHFSKTAQSSSCESFKKIQHRHAGY